PIYTNQGKGGGIKLLDNFVLNKSILSENEQNEILASLQSLNVIKYPNIDNTLSKLSSIFKKDNYKWIEVDFSNWGSSENEKEKFNTLKKAIMDNNVIMFKYYNSHGEKSNRKVEPMKLIFKAKSWYLQGFCLSKKVYRTFKITRMFNIQITEEIFVIKSLDKLHYRLYDEFDEKAIEKNKDGSFNVTTFLPEDDWTYGYILSFATNVEVIEPERVREIIIRKLENIIEKYK
ncbi:MAG: putative transcriptional regulator, partial [Bacillales bacterium]|nr:putative transcriptional regulator [Bacillales bacterium]